MGEGRDNENRQRLDVTVSTIEKLDLENMAIAVEILFIDAIKFEIHVAGVILPPSPVGHPKCKKILDTGGLSSVRVSVKVRFSVKVVCSLRETPLTLRSRHTTTPTILVVISISRRFSSSGGVRL